MCSNLSPEAARCWKGNFPLEQPCSPCPSLGDSPEQGALWVMPWGLGKPPSPWPRKEIFISNALSPLIQMAFRKRRCFSALINSPQSAYCLIPSSCHSNTVAHGERTGQSRLVPHHSPLRARVSCPLPVPAAAHHSTIPPLWHTAKPGGCHDAHAQPACLCSPISAR